MESGNCQRVRTVRRSWEAIPPEPSPLHPLPVLRHTDQTGVVADRPRYYTDDADRFRVWGSFRPWRFEPTAFWNFISHSCNAAGDVSSVQEHSTQICYEGICTPESFFTLIALVIML